MRDGTRAHPRRTTVVVLVVVILVAAACSSSASDDETTTTGGSQTAASANAPRIVDVDVVANPASVLSGWVDVGTAAPATVRVDLSGVGHTLSFDAGPDATTRHRVALVGLRPDRTYDITVTATVDGQHSSRSVGLSQGAADGALTFTTGPLPEDFPTITTSGSSTTEGWTLFPASRFGETVFGEVRHDVPRSYIVALDDDDQVVWYHADQGLVSAVSVLENGNILYLTDPELATEVTAMNEVVREWRTRSVDPDRAVPPGAEVVTLDVDSIHHAIEPLANGNFLALSTEAERRDFPEPLCGEEADEWTGGYDIITDRVIEFDPGTGAIGFDASIWDGIDPVERPGWAICGPQAQPAYGPDNVDWSHANALTVDTGNNAVLISNRHLDLILALRLRTDAKGSSGDVLWELGPEGDVELTNDDVWFSGQHAIQYLDDGTFALYDNGVSRTRLGDPSEVDAQAPQFTRSLHLRIDPDAKVAEVLDSSQRVDEAGDPLFAMVVGEVDVEDENTWRITDGGQLGDTGTLRAEIVEVDIDTGEVRHQIDVRGDREGWVVYRSELIDPLG